MKLNTRGHFKVYRILGIALLAVTSFTLPCAAADTYTNGVSFSDSFESYTNGTLLRLSSTNWYAYDDTMIVSNTYNYAGTPPLVTTHTKVMKLDILQELRGLEPKGFSQYHRQK